MLGNRRDGGQPGGRSGLLVEGSEVSGVGIKGGIAGCNVCGCLVLPGLDSLVDAGEFAFFWGGGQASADGVEVDIGHTGDDSGGIEEGLAFEPRFPEAAFDIVFFVGGASNEFVELSHEPADAGEAFADLGDALGATDEGLDFFFGGGGGRIPFGSVFGEECEPADGDFAIGPDKDDIGADAEDDMVVIIHDGVGPDFDGEDGGEVV